MSRAHRGRNSAAVACLTLLALAVAAAPSSAQTLPARMALVNAASEAEASEPAEPAQPSVEFRRVFVPAEAPQAWPVDGAQFLPLNRTEFEQLVSAAADASQPGGPARPRIAEAEYRAELSDGDALVGSATLRIEQPAPQRGLLPLAPLNIAVTGASWESAPERPPLIGVWARPGSAALEYSVAVDASDRLRLQWTAPPASSTGPSLQYALRLPRVATQRLELKLPTNCTASVEPSHLESKTASSDGQSTTWAFQLPAAQEHRVRVQRGAGPAAASPSQPLAAVAEDYRLTAEGLDYLAEWRIEPRGPLSELRFNVPAAMEIIAIEANRAPVAWQREVTPDGGDAGRVIVPLPAAAGPQTVTIKAAAPLTLDGPWTLPKITAADACWTEGTAALLVDAELELRGVTPRSASLVNVLGVGAAAGEAYRIQQWSANAEIETVIGRRQPVLVGQSAADIEFADRELVARSTIALRPEQGRTFDLYAAIQRYWNVEAVSAVPSGVLDTWHVEQLPGERRLRLQLRRWPTTDEPIVIIVGGRKRTSRPIASATIDSLRWLRFPEIRMADEWLAVRDRRGGKITPSGSLVDHVVDVASLSADAQQLVGGATGALVLAPAAADPLARVRVASRTAQFEGEAQVQLIRTATGFEHRVDVALQPTVGALDEALVTFARPLPADAAWQLDAQGGQLIVTRAGGTASEATAALAGAPAAGVAPATYRVQFGKPIAAPFHLRVAWRSDQQQSDSVNAVTMPGASAWHSWATLRADPRQVKVSSRGFASAAANPPARPDDPPTQVVACFRLSSDASPPPIETPSIEAVATTGSVVAGAAYCTFADLLTLCGAHGGQIHEARFDLETRGAEQATFALPEDVTIDEARINGVATVIERLTDGSGRSRIRLPRGRDDVQLVLRMRSAAPPLDSDAVVAPPWPKVSFEILRGRWTLAAPPRFVVADASGLSANAGWFRRLFGPLARRDADVGWQLPAAFGAAGNIRQASSASSSTASDDLAGRRLNVPRGWALASHEFSRVPRPMQVRGVDGHRANWFALWLASAATTAWLAGRRLRWTALAACVAAVGCLILPPTTASLAQAVFLGILTGLAVRTVVAGVPQPVMRDVGSAATRIALLIGSLLAAGAGASVHAEEAAALPPSVLIPIDADRQPAGDDVYVPAKLLSALRAAADAASPAGASAAITAARFEITLENQAPGEVGCRGGVLVLRCETMQPGARLTLPLLEDDAAWLDARHTLDGRPVALVWSKSGKSADVQLGDAGTSELRLHFSPRVAPLADRRQMSLRIPAFAGAVVDVMHPFGLQSVTIHSATPSVRQSNASRTVARLAAVDELKISWPAIADRAAPQAVNVAQLTWLHVERAAAQVDVRLRIDGAAAPLAGLELATSPQLRLAPPGDESPIQSVETTPGPPSVMKLKFRSLQPLPLTLDLRFHLQRTVSTGQIAYPSVRVLRATTRRSHFVVSADPRLRTHDEPTSGLAPITAAEADALWGGAPAKPLAQYAVTADEPQWSLAVEQSPPQFTAAESLDLLCQAAGARFEYAAAVDDVDGAVMMHELVVSPQAVVEDVIVADQVEGLPMTSRWTRPAPDRLCVFLGAPLSAAHVVRVAGSAAYSEEGRLPIPRVAIQRAASTTSELVLRRSSDAAVTWSGAGEPAAVLPSRDEGANSALVVGRYALPPAGAALGVLDVVRNDVDWEADALVTLDLSAADPVAQATISASVASGVLDRVRLTASLDWQGPFHVEGAEVVAREIPDEGRQLIEIRLAEPIAAGQQRIIRLAGELAVAADRRVRVPQVRLLGAATPRTFIAEPPSTNGQASGWTLAGLRREELPRALRQTPEAANAGATYLALRDEYVAEQRVFPHMMREPEVWLTATRGAVDAEGVLAAVAELVVQPGSADRCGVRLPPGAELLAAMVNDVPAVDLAAPEGVWQSPPGIPYLPRILTISYRQPLAARGGKQRLDAARAVVGGRELAAAEVLWQIDSDLSGPWEAVVGSSISPDRFDAAKQRRLVRAATEASPLAFRLPQWESRAWFEPWLRRLPEAADAGTPWAKLRQPADDASSPSPPTKATADGAAKTSAIAASAAEWYQAGDDGSLVLAARSSWSWLARWMAALAIVAAGAAIIRYPRFVDPIGHAVRAWPHASVAIAGIVWWLALSPSGVGLVIAALAAAFYVRTRLGGARRAPAERGSVVATGVG